MQTTIQYFIICFMLMMASCGSQLPDAEPLPPDTTFAGTWDTNWGQMILAQQGNHVHGTYKGFRNGSISGEVQGNLFTFRWTQWENHQWGRGYLKMNAEGIKMEGAWGNEKNFTNGGKWWATRAYSLPVGFDAGNKLAKANYLVVFSSEHNETTELAQVVLPVHHPLES